MTLIGSGGCGASGRNGEGPSAGCTVNGVACGLTCCGKECIDTSRDPRNCGGCGAVCPDGDICLGGRCGCPPFGDLCGTGQSCCGSNGCISLASDIRNCGGCGVTCPAGAACVGGSCAGASTPTPPAPGFCSCSDHCAGGTSHQCIGPDCCYDSYAAGECQPATSCGIWTY
jgi:hypothetical protein